MKKLYTFLFLSLILLSFNVNLKAQTQNPIWCVPPYYYNFPAHTLDTLPTGSNPYNDDYQGQSAKYAANAIADAQDSLLFFVTNDGLGDFCIYNGSNGAWMQDLGGIPMGVSEIPVVPKSCDEYYIFYPNDTPVPNAHIFNYAQNTLATISLTNPDSLPPNTKCNGCPHPPKEPPHNKDFNADGAFCPVIAVTKPFNNGERFVFTTSKEDISNYDGGAYDPSLASVSLVRDLEHFTAYQCCYIERSRDKFKSI